MNISELELLFKLDDTGIQCEGSSGPCNSRNASEINCRTRYSDQTRNINPILCEMCARDYNEYWDDMFDQYYHDRF